MADYLAANPDAKVCMETEFPDRPDGLILFEEATGYEVPQSQINILDTGLIYTETAKGACQFGEVFTTDGRITALNLELVEDPGVMILYNASYTFQNEVYSANADVYDEVVDEILDAARRGQDGRAERPGRRRGRVRRRRGGGLPPGQRHPLTAGAPRPRRR